MTDHLDNLHQLRTKALTSLEAVSSAKELEEWRVAYIGRKGAVPMLLRSMKDIPASERKVVGKEANDIRVELETLYAQKGEVFTEEVGHQASSDRLARVGGKEPEKGHLHPLTHTLQRIQNIFSALGFQVIEGPEVEDVEHSFDLLNIPHDHPARSESDTFHLDNGHVLRVQTSSMQVRAVREQNLKPPFRLLFPGRVFRSERTDATHETTFHQFEGLVVGDAITIADFKAVIETFFSTFFGEQATIRLRPSYFPFVEPGFEVDVSCVFCKQDGCRVWKFSGWIEVMGAGMVHPNVLMHMNLDPKAYQGFAFGGAADRLTMLRNGVTDIRLFWSGDIRFLKQFP